MLFIHINSYFLIKWSKSWIRQSCQAQIENCSSTVSFTCFKDRISRLIWAGEMLHSGWSPKQQRRQCVFCLLTAVQRPPAHIGRFGYRPCLPARWLLGATREKPEYHRGIALRLSKSEVSQDQLNRLRKISCIVRGKMLSLFSWQFCTIICYGILNK